MNFQNTKVNETQSNVFNKLSDKEREAMFVLVTDNTLNIIEYILKGLAEHRSTSLFHPHPYSSEFNYAVQDLIKKYRKQIEF